MIFPKICCIIWLTAGNALREYGSVPKQERNHIMAKKKAAIIGYGGMGGWHGSFLQNSDVVNLMGIYDIKPSQCALAESRGIHAYASLEELLADPAKYDEFIATLKKYDVEVCALACHGNALHPDKAIEFINTLPIESFWGVGKVTAKRMHALGIHYGKELREWSLDGLTREFGKAGKLYYDFARGIDLRPVEAVRVRKSIGCERTLERDIYTKAAVIVELYHTAEELIRRLAAKDFRGNTLTLKIKFHDFTQITRSITQEKELMNMRIIP